MKTVTTARSEEYKTQGFTIAKQLFSREEMERVKREANKVLKQRKEDEADSKIRTKDTGVLVGMSIFSEYLKQLNADPRMVEILKEILGENIEFLSDKIVFKSADVDFGSPWHQDWHYWQGSNKVSVWIALDDANQENGCLKFIPGSHQTPIDHTNDRKHFDKFQRRLDPNDIDESNAIDVPAACGDAVFFHDLLLHASYPNTSGKDRWALISTYRDCSQDDYEYPVKEAKYVVSGKKTGKEVPRKK